VKTPFPLLGLLFPFPLPCFAYKPKGREPFFKGQQEREQGEGRSKGAGRGTGRLRVKGFNGLFVRKKAVNNKNRLIKN
jgi:hypothetical protein